MSTQTKLCQILDGIRWAGSLLMGIDFLITQRPPM